MNAEIHSIHALKDSSALKKIAESAGISLEAARKVAAGIADLDVRQAIRIVASAHNHEELLNQRAR